MFETVVSFVHSAMGVWDLTIYQTNYEVYGYVFHLIFVFINIVLFFNTAIALMVETVNKMRYRGDAMSQKAVINLIPYYKYDQ